MTNERKLIEWFISGDTGSSSKSLAAEYYGLKYKYCSEPADPSDLGRCLRLIEIAPEIRKCVDSLAKKHKGWEKIAPVWDDIAKSMADEVGVDWSKGRSAPKTYKLMQQGGF